MQKVLLTLFFLYSMSAAISSKAQNFEGVWIPVKQELNGEPLPVDPQSKLTVQGGTYTFETTYDTDRGESTYGDGKMDIHSREGANKGKHFKAIYTMKGNQLTVCYNLAGDRYPETFETKGNALFFLCVFQRQQ
jgi:uncharacterized protein (TIGR03067 family)